MSGSGPPARPPATPVVAEVDDARPAVGATAPTLRADSATAAPPESADGRAGMDRYIEREARRVWRSVAHILSVDDLKNAGHLGLLEAQARFEPGLGVPFFPYARHRVRGAMIDAARDAGYRQRLRPPQALRDQAIAHEVIGPPAAGLAEGEPTRAQDAEAAWRTIARLATAYLVDFSATPTPDPSPSPERLTMRKVDLDRLGAALARASEEDRALLAAMYDFDGAGDSGASLAERLGISRSQVSRRHLRALDRLRRLMGVEALP